MSGNVFHPDELELRRVKPEWSRDELLNQEGIFFLKALYRPLDFSRKLFFRKLREVLAAKHEPWETMGARKGWTHWQVRMIVFASYYRKHLILPYSEVPADWDGNVVLRQIKGVYLLREISKLLPLRRNQLQYMARTNKDSKKELGIWKEDKYILVDLAVFCPWLIRYWKKIMSMGGADD